MSEKTTNEFRNVKLLKPGATKPAGYRPGLVTTEFKAERRAKAQAAEQTKTEKQRRNRGRAVIAAAGIAVGAIVAPHVGRLVDTVTQEEITVPAPGTPEAKEAKADGEIETITVRQGETPDGLAQQIHPGEDPRPLSDALLEQNDGQMLQAGQRLNIPKTDNR